jgi:hypothetical protein
VRVWICKLLTVREKAAPTQKTRDNHSQDNQSKPQHKKGNEKLKKDMGKWCEYHKIPWHNTEECLSKQSLVAELKASESEAILTLNQIQKEGSRIINVEPSATIATTKVHPSEPEEPEEGEHLFHSQMWVKGDLLHFIVDSHNQKNMISTEVVKWLDLPTTPHSQPYTIGWLHQGRDLRVSQQFLLPYRHQAFQRQGIV